MFIISQFLSVRKLGCSQDVACVCHFLWADLGWRICLQAHPQGLLFVCLVLRILNTVLFKTLHFPHDTVLVSCNVSFPCVHIP